MTIHRCEPQTKYIPNLDPHPLFRPIYRRAAAGAAALGAPPGGPP